MKSPNYEAAAMAGKSECASVPVQGGVSYVSRRSRARKGLALLGVASAIAYTHFYWTATSPLDRAKAVMGALQVQTAPGVCLTPACVHASSEILYNLSPDYKNINPCTDFEEMVCGGWRERHDLRPDQGDMFTGTIMSETSQTLLRHILEAPYPKLSEHSHFSPSRLGAEDSSADEKNFNKLKAAYDACLDESTIRKVGTDPLLKVMSELSARWHQSESQPLPEAILYLAGLGVDALISPSTGADEKDPDTVVVAVSAPWSIGLPAKEQYKDTEILKRYESVLSIVMSQLHPEKSFDNSTFHGVVELEKALAAASPDAEDRNDVTKYYNPMSLTEASNLAPRLHLPKIIHGLANVKVDRVIVMAPDYLKGLEKLLAETPVDVQHAYLLWKLVQSYSSSIEADAVDSYKRFRRELAGTDPDSTPERWRTCVGAVDSGLGWILSRFFVEKAFSAKAKEFGDQIVSDIKSRFIETLKATPWMEESVTDLAIEKVHNIVQKIGYPTKSPDIMDPSALHDYYKSVDVSSSAFFNNTVQTTKLQVRQLWSALGKPVDRNEWGMTVPTVNAYYNPPGNEIVFPAGIMQFPVFEVELPAYVSYGGFGSVSGHELSHAFDSTGRHYDQNGNYTDWWTNSTVEEFKKRAECFVDQYSNFTLEGTGGKTLHVNGRLTLGENIADAGGVAAAFAAWKKRAAEKPSQHLPGLGHFTQEQLFFVSYSSWWCGTSTKEAAENRIYVDPHAPKWARVLGTMSNSRDFRESFQCPKKEPVCELW